MTLQKSLKSISACSLIGRNSFFFGRWFVLCSEKAALVSIDNAGTFRYNHVKAFLSARNKPTPSLNFPFKAVNPFKKVKFFEIVDYILFWNG